MKVDDKWQEMAEGYPKIKTDKEKTLFIFRFPKFSKEVSYDPIIELSDSENSKDNNTAATMHIEVIPTLLAIAALLKLIL